MSNPVQTQVNDALEPSAEFPSRAEREIFTGDEGSSAVEPRIPEHELLRIIGKGAYGEVWLARNVMGTYRAVKIVFRCQFENDRPYEREFKGIQKFEPVSRSHDGFVDVLQIGRNDQAGYFYYVMELADSAELKAGEGGGSGIAKSVSDARPRAHWLSSVPDLGSYSPRTLRAEWRVRGRLGVDECIALGLTLASALEHLHTNALVHRDIKPSNIIFVNGVPKLADIGLVADVSEAKSFVGTLGYIPPEGPGTVQGDLYSLGKVLYEMSTGRDRNDFPQLPSNLRELSSADALIEFNEVLLKACESEPRRRYQSAVQMRKDLELLQRGKSLKHQRALQRAWAVCRKACLGIGFLGLTTVAILVSVRWLSDRELHSVSPEAERLVKRGDSISASSAPERLAVAVRFFEAAIKKDPRFAPAYIDLFAARLGQLNGTDYPATDAIVNLRIAATNLMRVAPTLAEAQIAASQLKWLDGRQDEALAAAEKATKMRAASKEGLGFVHEIYGCYLLRTGDQERSFQEYLLAEKYNPADATVELQLGNHYFVEHDYVKALEHFNRSLEIDDRQFEARWCEGCVYEEQGAIEKAVREFREADAWTGKNDAHTERSYADLLAAYKEGGGTNYWNERLRQARAGAQPEPHQIAVILAHMGQTNEAYKYLKQACDEKKLEGLWFDPCWDRSDPRFKEIAGKVRSRP